MEREGDRIFVLCFRVLKEMKAVACDRGWLCCWSGCTLHGELLPIIMQCLSTVPIFRIVGVVELVTKSRSLIGFGRMVHLSHVPPTRPGQLGRVFQDTGTHLYYVIKLAIVPPENIQTPVSVVVGGCGCWLLQLS